MRGAEAQVRQRQAALEQAEQGAMNRVKQNQKELERRAAEWHQEATRQIDETARKQKMRAQQLHSEEQRLERLRQLVNHERDMPLALGDRNRKNDPLALEDVNSPGVRRRAREAASLESGQEMLKTKIKSMEEKYALSQQAIADAEDEMEQLTKRMASVDRDLEEAKRKQEQQSETILKKEQSESATKAEIAELKLELEVTQQETGTMKAALEDLEISSQRDRTRAKNQLSILQTEHEQALEEITSLESKNKAYTNAQEVKSKLEAELRNLKEENEQLQAQVDSAQRNAPVDWSALKASLGVSETDGDDAAPYN